MIYLTGIYVIRARVYLTASDVWAVSRFGLGVEGREQMNSGCNGNDPNN